MRNNKGFTLIEVVSSLVIIGIALVAVLNMFSISSKSLTTKQQRAIVYNLLQRKIEEAKTGGFARNLTEVNTTYPGYADYVFNVTQTASYLGNPFLKRVAINCRWVTPSGNSRQETVTTLVAQKF